MKKSPTRHESDDALYSSLSSEKFNRISSCETSKEIWDILSITCEGTNKVKKSKVNHLL